MSWWCQTYPLKLILFEVPQFFWKKMCTKLKTYQNFQQYEKVELHFALFSEIKPKISLVDF